VGVVTSFTRKRQCHVPTELAAAQSCSVRKALRATFEDSGRVYADKTEVF